MKRVLVVDDHVVVRELFEGELLRAGYETDTACNGVEALEKIEHCRPDLILLDVSMPVMDGIATLRAIHDNPRISQIPVLVLSGVADKSKVIEAGCLGIAGYLLKASSTVKTLLSQVECAIRGSSPTVASVAAPPPQPSATIPLQRADQRRVPDTGKESDPAIQRILTKTAVTAAIDRCDELKGLSPAASELLKIVDVEGCSIDHVAGLVGRDPGVALKILKLANSLVYRRGGAVDNVSKAIVRLGLAQVRQTIINLATIERFSSVAIEGFIDSELFWEHSIATGIIASQIAGARGKEEANGAFSMGLLHDVGRMFLVNEYPDAYQRILQRARELDLPVETVEKQMLEFDHAEITDRLLTRWKFPAEFVKPIVFHHRGKDSVYGSAASEMMQIATLALADRLAHAFMLGSSGNETIYPTEELIDILRLEPSLIRRIEDTVIGETREVILALLPKSRQSKWPQMRDAYRRSLARPFRPLYVSGNGANDAHRIFCDRLANWDGVLSPNVGVLWLREVNDQEQLSRHFLTLETERNVKDLPLIVISPDGKTVPKTLYGTNRRIESIVSPFSINRFVNVVNELLEEA